MTSSFNNLQTLLLRTPLTINFDELALEIQKQFPILGEIASYNPINEGYEDANIFLKTNLGEYVLKIFLTERSQDTINDYVKIILESTKLGIKTTKLIEGVAGHLGYAGNANYIITEFFSGQNFQQITPSLEDMYAGLKYLTKLNTLSFPIHETYDSWGNKNLLKEYENLRRKLTSTQLNLIDPIIEEFGALDFSRFSRAVIHGDMQRKHLLKNSSNEYCMLDFGCISFGPKIIDLSTFLAWFCLAEDTWKDRDLIFNSVTEKYCKAHNLSVYELDSIKTLIIASYAAYYQKTSELIYDGDTSPETNDWHKKSKKMIELTTGW